MKHASQSHVKSLGGQDCLRAQSQAEPKQPIHHLRSLLPLPSTSRDLTQPTHSTLACRFSLSPRHHSTF